MHPTYNVMIYLAAALIEFQERSISDGGAQMRALLSAAPQTIRAIGEMPHFREKFQGVLIRRQVLQGDKTKKPREPYVWTGGILGVEGTRRAVPRFDHDDGFALEEHSEEDQVVAGDQIQPLDAVSTVASAIERPDIHDERLLYDSDDPSHVSQRIADPQDEHDIEIETLLESRRRRLGINSPEAEDEAEGV
jgi:pentatricopeptide repeat-containing protein PET309